MNAEARYRDWRRATGGRMKQSLPELETAMSVVRALEPRVFLEVGSWCGGTLDAYASVCAPGALVISVDIGHAQEHLLRTVWRLTDQGYDAQWVCGSSHNAEALETVRELLDGRPVDFLHVDGDHTRQGVLMDWRMYGPLLRVGGLAAFHDVTFLTRCQVFQAWPEIRAAGAAWCTITGPDRPGYKHPTGIGLVWIGEDTWPST